MPSSPYYIAFSCHRRIDAIYSAHPIRGIAHFTPCQPSGCNMQQYQRTLSVCKNTCSVTARGYLSLLSNTFTIQSCSGNDFRHGRKFVVKCGVQLSVKPIHSHLVDVEAKFYKSLQIPILFLAVFYKQH